MKKVKTQSIIMFFIVACFSCNNIRAQEKIIPLPQSIPASEAAGMVETTIATNPDKTIVYNVSKPELLYYPAPNNISGTSVIIAPGGALQILSIDNEGVQVAKYLNANGIDAFVLKYSLFRTVKDISEIGPNFLSDDQTRDANIAKIIPYAMKDGLNAVEYVRKNAKELELDPDRIGFMGFSAGGTVTMSVVYNCNDANRPNFIAPVYGWIGEIQGNVPQVKTPAFIVVANDDNLKLVPHSISIYEKWNNASQPVELLIYGKGGHGFGSDKNYNPTDGWMKSFVDWLGSEGLLWPENPQGQYANRTYIDYLKNQAAQEEARRLDWANIARYNSANEELASNPVKDAVVFYGNSITDFWIRNDKDFFEKNGFIDRGISAQTTSQMIVRFYADVVSLKPSAMVILAGTNDIAGNTGPISIENIFGNIVSMAEIARANNIKPFICSVLPVYKYSWSPDVEPVGKINELNRMLKDYAMTHKIAYVDYYSIFADEKGAFPQQYSPDGVHPNLEGYKIMEEAVSKALIKSKIRKSVTY
jgi:acetyl esterase/lipase/lysophospholipase L1-like esterase